MPLQAPHAEQARLNSSIALVDEGAPARGLSDLSPAAARLTLTPHRAISSWVCRPVARTDAKASLTAGASALSAGKVMISATCAMAPLEGRAHARSGRTSVNTPPDRGA